VSRSWSKFGEGAAATLGRWEVEEGFCEGVIPVTGSVYRVHDLYLICTPVRSGQDEPDIALGSAGQGG